MAEKEYIERGALIENIFPLGMPNDGNYPINAKAVKNAIEKAPASDMVCRDDVIEAFEDYIAEMTISKWGTHDECMTARSAVKMAVKFVLGERNEQT